METVGIQRWPGFVADAAQRARDPATQAAIEKSRQPPAPSGKPSGFPRGRDAIRPVYPVETLLGVGAAAAKRPNAKIGSGSTADAVRFERATGQPTGGAWHTQKAEEGVIRLQRWLQANPAASPGDRAAAENVIRDLQNALAGK